MTPATMDSSSLVCVEDGSVELLEFTWPPVGPDDSEDTPRASCLCYAVMRRPGGFLLCLPSGFVPADVLRAGEEASAGDLVGLSTGLSVPPISLTDEGDWVRPTDAAPVPALVLDLSDAGAECLAQADLQVSDAAPFVLDRPGIFPLASEVASEVLRQARAWAASGSQPDRSGYQTAVSDAPGARQVKAGPRPKRPTVAQLASQQEALSKAVAGIAEQLTALRAQGDASPGPRKPAPTPLPGQLSLLAAPVSSPGATTGRSKNKPSRAAGPSPSPSELQSFFERPGPSRGGAHWFRRRCRRAASSRGPLERLPCRGNAAAVKGSERTGVPALPVSGPPRSGPLDGRRLWTLDPRHLRKAEDASRAPPSGRLLRTAAPADRLETHIPYGHRECRAGPHDTVLRAVRRFWKPKAARSSPVPAGPGQRPPCTRLSPAGASDLVAQLIIMIDQVNADGGKHDLGFLFSLQPDPPSSVFVNHPSLPTAALRPFSPLADSRLVASTLAYGRRLEYGTPPKKPGGPAPSGKDPPLTPGGNGTGAEPALTKKQQRAKAWASRRAAEGS